MAFEVSTVTLVGGEITVLEFQLKRIIGEMQASHSPDRARVYDDILDKIAAAKTEIE